MINRPGTAFTIVQSHFRAADPKLHAVLATVDLADWWEDRDKSDHFYNLAREIIYQQLSGKAAGTIFGRFSQLVGDKVRPEEVVKLEDQQLRDVGLSWAKARYVKDLAAKVLSREVMLDNLHQLSDQGVVDELVKVKGIGQWTAEMFLLFTLQREDIFSHGDLGLKNGFAKLYEVENPTQAQIEAVISRWSPYKSYGSIALWHYLDNRPR